MAGKPAFQFYPGDWKKDPQLRACSLAARGFWIEILCDIFNSESDGTIERSIESLARMAGGFPDEVRALVKELEANGVADIEWGHERDITGHERDTVRITSRRLKREAEQRKVERDRKRRYRAKNDDPDDDPDSCPDDVPTHVPLMSSRSSIEEEKEVEEEVKEKNKGGVGEKGKTTTVYQHPAIEVYADAFGASIPINFQERIISAVGKDPPDLQTWQDVVTLWKTSRYNARNVPDMLNNFKRLKNENITAAKIHNLDRRSSGERRGQLTLAEVRGTSEEASRILNEIRGTGSTG